MCALSAYGYSFRTKSAHCLKIWFWFGDDCIARAKVNVPSICFGGRGKGLKWLGCCGVGGEHERCVWRIVGVLLHKEWEMESTQHTWGPLPHETENILLTPK